MGYAKLVHRNVFNVYAKTMNSQNILANIGQWFFHSRWPDPTDVIVILDDYFTILASRKAAVAGRIYYLGGADKMVHA